MNITRRHIRVAAFASALAVLLQIAPVSTGGQPNGNRPVTVTFAKWTTGVTTATVLGNVQEGRVLMAGVAGGDVAGGTFVGEVLQRQPSANSALKSGIVKLEAIYEIHDAEGDHVFTALIRGGANATGAALLDGVILAGWRTGAPVHVEFKTVVGCDGAPTPATTCFVGTIEVGRTTKGNN